MKDSYSLYEAKAKLSAIVRQVREGHAVVVTLHGEPVVEIRPLAPKPEGIAARMKSLVERGILTPAKPKARSPRVAVRRPGALKRFLDDRNA